MARSLAERLRKQRIWSTEFRCWTLSEQGTLNSEQPYEARRLALENVASVTRALLDAIENENKFSLEPIKAALAAVPEIPEE